MSVFIIRRIIQSVISVLIISVIVFLAVYAAGDPVEIFAPPDASLAERDLIRENLGLNLPLWHQYFNFMKNALSGNLGVSFIYSVSAMDLVALKFPATLELVLVAMVIGLILGIPFGMVAGLWPRAFFSRVIMSGSILGFSLPAFWVGIMLILIFSVELDWLPSYGRGETIELLGVKWSIFTWDGIQHILLPALNLAIFRVALFTRITRAGIMENVLMDYVKFARAKGLSSGRILFVHILKNISIPLITVSALELGGMLAFAVVTESIFAWPGMGKLIIDSISFLDRPVIVAYVMIVVFMFLVLNMIVDLIYTLIDPRIRAH